MSILCDPQTTVTYPLTEHDFWFRLSGGLDTPLKLTLLGPGRDERGQRESMSVPPALAPSFHTELMRVTRDARPAKVKELWERLT